MNDIGNIDYQEKIVFKALEELDRRLYEIGTAPFELNVVGGFALLLEGIRLSDYTDIDYVGNNLNKEIKDIVEEVGLQYGLGRGWVNNDVLLSGSTLEDLESSTGELRFNHRLDLNVITVNSLDKSCLLRMKVIAVDTSFAAAEFGSGEFTRAKDFVDIKLLADNLGMTYNNIVEDNFEYVICQNIFYLIKWYMKFVDLSVFSDFNKINKIIKTKGRIDVRND